MLLLSLVNKTILLGVSEIYTTSSTDIDFRLAGSACSTTLFAATAIYYNIKESNLDSRVVDSTLLKHASKRDGGMGEREIHYKIIIESISVNAEVTLYRGEPRPAFPQTWLVRKFPRLPYHIRL